MELYLVRHAVAFVQDPNRWPDDRERPLTPEGEKRFRRAVKGLSRSELLAKPDAVLSSPWVRAWQTAEILSKEADWPAPVASEALEAGRAPAEVLQALQSYTGARSLALVGHEPSLHELASYLLTADTGHAQIELKKGAIATLEMQDGLRPGSARMRLLLSPKVLRELA